MEADPVTPGWRFLHIGIEGDHFLLDGIDVWEARWVSAHGRVTVAHPSYPKQRHTMLTYWLSGPGRTLELAAGEFSNGVWGFFVPDGGIRNDTGWRPPGSRLS